MSVHFGGRLISNTLDQPVTLIDVHVDDQVMGEVEMMDTIYGQWDEVGREGTIRGYWDEWPPHPSEADGDEPPVQALDLPVIIEPDKALNPLTGFRVDATDGPVHIPYVLYTYEVRGRTYELVDGLGIRVEPDQASCDVMPEIFTEDFSG
jgi:hypothetical protein